MRGSVVGRNIFTDTSKRGGGGIIFSGYGNAGWQNIIPSNFELYLPTPHC
jgi:hypothetical protein